jgi:hypothetical protein
MINSHRIGENMAWDRSWRCRQKKLSLSERELASQKIAKEYEGVSVSVEKESDECITCFFTVPAKSDDRHSTIELSIYDMGKDGFVLSLEADASDNQLSEDADQLAEDLAAELEAVSLEL